MNRNPQIMAPEEIAEEIRNLREDLKRKARRIFELSRALYTKARRSTVDDNTSRILLYANAWSRFAGMVDQGLRRTASTDRWVRDSIQSPQLEETQEPVQVPEAPSVVEEGDDLNVLYGEEVVNHALQQ